jgi:hypothetical protein
MMFRFRLHHLLLLTLFRGIVLFVVFLVRSVPGVGLFVVERFLVRSFESVSMVRQFFELIFQKDPQGNGF